MGERPPAGGERRPVQVRDTWSLSARGEGGPHCALVLTGGLARHRTALTPSLSRLRSGMSLSPAWGGGWGDPEVGGDGPGEGAGVHSLVAAPPRRHWWVSGGSGGGILRSYMSLSQYFENGVGCFYLKKKKGVKDVTETSLFNHSSLQLSGVRDVRRTEQGPGIAPDRNMRPRGGGPLLLLARPSASGDPGSPFGRLCPAAPPTGQHPPGTRPLPPFACCEGPAARDLQWTPCTSDSDGARSFPRDAVVLWGTRTFVAGAVPASARGPA